MLSCVFPARERQPCGRLPGEFLPALRQPRSRALGLAGCLLGQLRARGEAEFGLDVGGAGLHGARQDESLVAMSLLPSPR